jgi:hypothetical protein
MGKRPVAHSRYDEIEWRNIEDNDNMSIGRFINHPNYVAVVRTMFLPLGKPPRMK